MGDDADVDVVVDVGVDVGVGVDALRRALRSTQAMKCGLANGTWSMYRLRCVSVG